MTPLCPERGDKRCHHGLPPTLWYGRFMVVCPLSCRYGMPCHLPWVMYPIHPLLVMPCGSPHYPVGLEQEASGSCFPGEGKSSAPWGMGNSAALRGGSRGMTICPPPFAASPTHSAPGRLLPGAFMAQKAVSQPEPWGTVLCFIDCSFHSPLAHDPTHELSTVPSTLCRHRAEPCHAGKAEASSSHQPLPISPPRLPLAWK